MLNLSTVADAQISNPPWVKFQSAGWVNFPSAPTKSEQKGFANLLIGLFGAVRNPLAHATKTNWPMSEQDALDIFSMVSLMHRKLDGVRKTTP